MVVRYGGNEGGGVGGDGVMKVMYIVLKLTTDKGVGGEVVMN